MYFPPLCRCQQSSNVVYTPGLVEGISPQNENLKLISVKESAETWYAGMIVVAAGGMGGQKFVQYEQSSWPHVGAQTAYGIECEVGKMIEALCLFCFFFFLFLLLIFPCLFPCRVLNAIHSHLFLPPTDSHAFDLDVMHFMDYRDYNMQLHHSNNKNGVSATSVPSFLYAMPLSPKRIFFEETCLAAKEPLSFEALRERLTQRLHWLGITVSPLFLFLFF